MEKKILVPTDFSENAWNALKYAINLFKTDDCTFFLLNAFHSENFPADSVRKSRAGEAVNEQAKKDSEAGLERLIETLSVSTENAKHNFSAISIHNTVTEAIKKCLDKKDIDLIIMGTNGNDKPPSRILGSNALKVIEKITTCPVLVIPEKSIPPQGNKKEIVFATNYKVDYRQRELNYIQGIAHRCAATIHILYIGNQELDPEQKINKFKLEEFFAEDDHSFHTITTREVAEGIHSFIRSRGSQLLALIHTDHSFFKDFFSESVIRESSGQDLVPLLILHE